jgi:hypothetical protein
MAWPERAKGEPDMKQGYRIRLNAAVLGLFLLLAGPASQSLAGSCKASGAEATRLARQVAANLALANRHDCGSGSAAFACREIAARIVQAKQMLARSEPACKPQVPPTVAGAARKTTTKAASNRPATRKMPETARAMPGSGTLCVRLSDGYYFPTPNSGFQTKPVETATLAAQCRFICETADMDVFARDTTSGLPADMVSLTTGKRYDALPQSGRYRQASSAQACDMGRFYRAALQAESAPSPALKEGSASEAVAALGHPALFQDVSLRGTTTDMPRASRKVRVVGPTFLPAL